MNDISCSGPVRCELYNFIPPNVVPKISARRNKAVIIRNTCIIHQTCEIVFNIQIY